jgi:predicted anti-sigma-YlaC factor YlaD
MREEIMTIERTKACALIQDLLPLYLDNEISRDSYSVIAEHLTTCDHCVGFLSGARTVRDMLRREQQVRKDIVASDYQDQGTIVASRRMFMTTIAVVVITVAALVIGLALVPMFLNPPGM